jgi:uncharacterized protein (TIGR02391 family)
MNLQDEIHPDLWTAIEKSYESGIYKNAILDAIHFLSDQIREKADVDGDGAALVGQAFGGENPPLRINKFQTETERNEQKGLEQILRGVYIGIRNPRSHEQGEDSQATANSIILFINLLFNIINTSKEQFSLDEWMKKIFDKDFVASARYADLLTSEVPPKKVVETLIEIYRNKLQLDGDKLEYIFNSLFASVESEKLDDFINVVSENLQSSDNDKDIILSLRILPAGFWPRITETARLRIENKLIKSIHLGEYNNDRDACVNGQLGTWASGFIRYFTLKSDLRKVLIDKLIGNDLQSKEEYNAEVNYVARFFYSSLTNTITESSNTNYVEYLKLLIINAILKALSTAPEATTLREQFSARYNLPEDWINLFLKEIESGKFPASDLLDEYVKRKPEPDIPF